MTALTLEQAHRIGDDEADEVVARFMRTHPDLRPRDAVAAMVAELRRGRDAQSEEVRTFLLEGPDLPEWATDDMEVIRRGQKFFRDYGLFVGASLFCASLPEAYAAADGVEVLAVTAELVTHARRRIAETGRFLVDVMALDGTVDTLAPGNKGYRAVRGVRLMHAAVRAFVRSERGPEWIEAHGEPVNQRDLVGTLLTFTSVVFSAFDRLGIEYDQDDAEAYLRTWRLIGHLLGINDDLLPWSRYEADQQAAVLRAQLHRASPAGTELARALLDELEESVPRPLRAVPRTVTRHLIGDKTADLLELPRSAWWRGALPSLRSLSEVGGVNGPSAVVARLLCKRIGRSLFAEYIERGLEGRHAPFEIPDDLARHWRLQRGRRGRARRRRRRQSPVLRISVTQ